MQRPKSIPQLVMGVNDGAGNTDIVVPNDEWWELFSLHGENSGGAFTLNDVLQILYPASHIDGVAGGLGNGGATVNAPIGYVDTTPIDVYPSSLSVVYGEPLPLPPGTTLHLECAANNALKALVRKWAKDDYLNYLATKGM